jgi:hypothetical protein
MCDTRVKRKKRERQERKCRQSHDNLAAETHRIFRGSGELSVSILGGKSFNKYSSYLIADTL